VLQDGSDQSASLLIISHFRSPSGVLVVVPSRYFFAIGLLLYLAFDDRYHRFTLHYQARLLTRQRLDYGPLTLSGAPFLQASSRGYHNSARRLPSGLLPVHSLLLGKSLLVSSPPSRDMLKSKGSSVALPLFGDRAVL